ncbi:MAG: hypothetical protein ACK5MU_04275 [Candidatus Saccharimonadales bacterium]
MPNKDLFSDSSIVPAKGTTSVAPYQPNGQSTAMMLAAADPATRKNVMDAVMSENCKLLLATTALEGAVMLSLMETQLTSAVPSGAHRYKLIADTYTASAANRIARW